MSQSRIAAEVSEEDKKRDRNRLVKGGVGSILVAASRPVIELLLALVLVRVLGSAGYGQFTYAIVLITFLAIPVQSGLPTLVVRQTASYLAEARWGRIKGLWSAATTITLVYSVAGICVVAGTLWLFSSLRETPFEHTLAWALALMPVLILISVSGSKLRGLGLPVQGQIGEQIVRPALFTLLVLAAWKVPLGWDLTPEAAVGINIIAALLALALTQVLLIRTSVMAEVAGSYSSFSWGLWLKSLLPLAFIGGVQIVSRQTDILIIGMMESDESVGIYRVTAQLASLGLLVLQAVGYTLSPYFARLSIKRDVFALQRFARRAAQVTLAGAVSVFAAYWLFGTAILTNAFGPEFQAGANALLILAFGHVVSGFFGPVGFLLTMTGHERQVFLVLGVSAGMNVALNFLLIPVFGIEGAALATLIGMLVWNLGFWWVARNSLNVRSTAIGL